MHKIKVEVVGNIMSSGGNMLNFRCLFEVPIKQLDASCFGGYIQLLGGHLQDECAGRALAGDTTLEVIST